MLITLETELVTPPEIEPLTFAEIVDHNRLNEDEANAERQVIERLIISAREEVEDKSCIAIMEQTRRLWLDEFPTRGDMAIDLPRSPVISMVSVKYVDSNGTLQTVPFGNESPPLEAEYVLDNKSFPAAILPIYNGTWPTARCQRNAVQVEYVCGFGTRPEDVPERLRREMSRLVGHWFENRETTAPGDDLPKEIDDQLSQVIAHYRISYF